MKRVVRWNRAALADLGAQAAYIAQHNLAAARRVADAISAASDDLAEFAIGRPGQVEGTFERVLTTVPYTLIYTVQARAEDSETASILRVVHHAKLWPRDET